MTRAAPRLLLALALLAPFAAAAQAPAPEAPVPAAPVPAAAPAAPIAMLDAGLLQVMHDGQTAAFADRVKLLEPIVQKVFDLPLILRNSVGPAWGAIPPPQQADLLHAFTDFTVATWVANFDDFKGEQFRISPQLRQVGSDQVVETRLVPSSGTPTRLDYVMRDVGGSWRVVDILLDGTISRVAVQRSDFRAQVSGGDPGQLAAMLRSKAATLADGTKS